MRRLIALLTALLLLPMTCLGEASSPDKQVDRILKSRHATGAALLVAMDGKVVYEHYYGYAMKADKVPVTAETMFRAASVSKFVSAIGVMALVEQGRLKLDEDISVRLGYLVRNKRIKAADKEITLRMVMSHTSSLKDKGDYNKGAQSLQTILSAKTAKAAGFTKYEPGAYYHYANINGGLLGTMMELGSGQSVTAFMEQRVFGPLGIRATYDLHTVSDTEHLSYTYNSKGQLEHSIKTLMNYSYQDKYDPDAHFRVTAARLWITAPGLLRLGMMMEQDGTLDGVTVLQPDTVAEMISSQKGKGGITADSIYGLNVHRASDVINGVTLYGHQGLTDGVTADIYFEPVNHFVFCFISNGIDNTSRDSITLVARSLIRLCWQQFAAGNPS